MSTFIHYFIWIWLLIHTLLSVLGNLISYGKHVPIRSNLEYDAHRIPKHNCFSSRLAVVSAQAIEAKCLVENEDMMVSICAADQWRVCCHQAPSHLVGYIEAMLQIMTLHFSCQSHFVSLHIICVQSARFHGTSKWFFLIQLRWLVAAILCTQLVHFFYL